MYGGFADAKGFGGRSDGDAVIDDELREFRGAFRDIRFHVPFPLCPRFYFSDVFYKYSLVNADMTNSDKTGTTARFAPDALRFAVGSGQRASARRLCMSFIGFLIGLSFQYRPYFLAIHKKICYNNKYKME